MLAQAGCQGLANASETCGFPDWRPLRVPSVLAGVTPA